MMGRGFTRNEQKYYNDHAPKPSAEELKPLDEMIAEYSQMIDRDDDWFSTRIVRSCPLSMPDCAECMWSITRADGARRCAVTSIACLFENMRAGLL